MEGRDNSDGDGADNERNDGRYPSAPIPPHERVWRHPSEMGEATWVRTEPPVAIGRGLLITTGVIGGLMGLAVMWAMLPIDTRSGVTALSTVADRQSTGSEASGEFIRETTVPTTELQQHSSTTLAAPVPTMHVAQHSVTETPAIAVAVGDGWLVITTAAAVAGDTTVMLALASGEVAQARVVMVDIERGLAVLSPQLASATESFELAPPTRDGDVVTVLGNTRRDLQVRIDDAGVASLETWANADTLEGTPVVDSEGRLVGLCSRAELGPELVLLGDIDALHAAVVEFTGGQVWLGVQLNDDPAGALTIDAVDPNGPAAVAGLAPGDIVVAVDGRPITDRSSLVAVLARHFPGDLTAFTVTRQSGAERVVVVTLGIHHPTL